MSAQDTYTDLLTGARTRNGMTVDFAKPHRFPAGVIVADINGTLKIMKEHGFAMADNIIADMAKIIRRVLPDAVIYRMGGDLFSMVFENIREDDFNEKVLLLEEALLGNSRKRRKIPRYNVSVGAFYEKKERDLRAVVFDALNNMYANKQRMYRVAGSEGSRYRPSQDKVLRFMKKNELRKTIAAGRFLVYYQPQVSISDGVLRGAEALIRYVNDDGSVSFPIDFIPTLESSRRISELDFFVFEHVCKKLRAWNQKKQRPVCIATNFSRYTITEEGFADRLLAIRERYGIPPEQVEVEITETVAGESGDLLRATTVELHRRGFRISIDDFGVSHSNLSLLTDVEFDVLKFDKSVIDSMYTRLPGGKTERRNKTVLLLSSLIGVCHQMNVKTIAEGIEEQAQADILDIINCDLAQGYLYSRPVPEAAFEALLKRGVL